MLNWVAWRWRWHTWSASNGHKYHYAIADYLQRSARHISAKTDLDQAIAVGEAAAHYAAQGMQAVMPAIIRGEGSYTWTIEPADLSDVETTKILPRISLPRTATAYRRST